MQKGFLKQLLKKHLVNAAYPSDPSLKAISKHQYLIGLISWSKTFFWLSSENRFNRIVSLINAFAYEYICVGFFVNMHLLLAREARPVSMPLLSLPISSPLKHLPGRMENFSSGLPAIDLFTH
jgi:hypothetical protein